MKLCCFFSNRQKHEIIEHVERLTPRPTKIRQKWRSSSLQKFLDLEILRTVSDDKKTKLLNFVEEKHNFFILQDLLVVLGGHISTPEGRKKILHFIETFCDCLDQNIYTFKQMLQIHPEWYDLFSVNTNRDGTPKTYEKRKGVDKITVDDVMKIMHFIPTITLEDSLKIYLNVKTKSFMAVQNNIPPFLIII